MAWHGRARRGMGCDGSTEGPRAFPAAFIGGHGAVCRGRAGHGSAGCGVAGCGVSHRRWHGGLRPSLPPSQGWTWLALVRLALVAQGTAGHGGMRHGLQTAARSLFGGSLLLSSEGSSGGARSGKVGYGGARPGKAWQGLTTSVRRAQAFPTGLTQHTSWHDQQKST